MGVVWPCSTLGTEISLWIPLGHVHQLLSWKGSSKQWTTAAHWRSEQISRGAGHMGIACIAFESLKPIKSSRVVAKPWQIPSQHLPLNSWPVKFWIVQPNKACPISKRHWRILNPCCVMSNSNTKLQRSWSSAPCLPLTSWPSSIHLRKGSFHFGIDGQNHAGY